MLNKKFMTLMAGVLAFSPALMAENLPAGPESTIGVSVASIDLQGDNLVVNLNLNTNGVSEPSKEQTVYVPMIINGPDTVCFETFAVDGHKRWLYESQSGQYSPVTFQGWGKEAGKALTAVPSSGSNYSVSGSGYNYNLILSTPFQAWMGNAQFVIDCLLVGCSTCVYPSVDSIQEVFCPLAETNFPPEEFVAEIVYAEPTNEIVKLRNIVSNAYIDFRVNQTNILPKYMNNPTELAAIKASIDSIAADNDVDIQSITIHGMASPEGPFNNNERLAKGRTDALKNYIQKQHKLPKDMISSTYEPVINWAGLANWLTSPACQQNASVLPNAGDILAIVNSNLPDFDRNQKIKTTYPDQYNWLLKNVYPSLRVSEYIVNFQVREYTEVAEIIDVMRTAPNKLSVAEIFEAATSQGEDTALFEEAVNIAVTTYPENEDANLNAGLLALKKGNYTQAKAYLDKAGNSDAAKLARAQLAAKTGQERKALEELKALEKSSDASVAKTAKEAAESLEKIVKFYKK